MFLGLPHTADDWMWLVDYAASTRWLTVIGWLRCIHQMILTDWWITLHPPDDWLWLVDYAACTRWYWLIGGLRCIHHIILNIINGLCSIPQILLTVISGCLGWYLQHVSYQLNISDKVHFPPSLSSFIYRCFDYSKPKSNLIIFYAYINLYFTNCWQVYYSMHIFIDTFYYYLSGWQVMLYSWDDVIHTLCLADRVYSWDDVIHTILFSSISCELNYINTYTIYRYLWPSMPI